MFDIHSHIMQLYIGEGGVCEVVWEVWGLQG